MLLNLFSFLTLFIISAFSDRQGHDPFLYVLILLAICSLPILFAEETNGKYSLLVVSCPILFVFYGINDILTYFFDIASYWQAPAESVFTGGEIAILLGLSSWMIGYVLAVRMFSMKKDAALVLDWNIWSLVWIGFLCLGLGIWATWIFQVSSSGGKNSLSGSNILALVVLGRMLEPVGSVLLSYTYLKTKRSLFLIIILMVAVVKLPLGIILNSKEVGISFIAIFLVTKWLYDGKIPLRWIAIAVIGITFYFPISYAYRTTIGLRHIDVSHSLNDVSSLVEKALEENQKTSDSVSGIQSFASRVDLKSLMELIVSRVGHDVSYQNGHTFIELPYVFLPRFIIDKPAVSTGQLFNREFHISANPDTYISTSFLGELYWNFGWAGVVAGMLVVGYSWGVIGSRSNLKHNKSVTRLLILVSAIYLFSLRFESGVVQQYIVFIRSAGIILVLHLLFRSRRPTRDTGSVT